MVQIYSFGNMKFHAIEWSLTV